MSEKKMYNGRGHITMNSNVAERAKTFMTYSNGKKYPLYLYGLFRNMSAL